MLELDYYKSEKGIYVAPTKLSYSISRDVLDKKILINGKEGDGTQHPAWKFFAGSEKIEFVKKIGTKPIINLRWELVDKESSGSLPVTITPEDAKEEWHGDDYCMGYLSKWKKYESFYERRYEYGEVSIVDVEFSTNFLGNVEDALVVYPNKLSYPVYRSKWEHKDTLNFDIASAASYEELAEIFTPSILIHNTHCYLTSRQTYKIIRRYVQDHINRDEATITSDYDFCFTVKKKIAVKTNTSSTEKGKPRVAKTKLTKKMVEVFEMTHEDKKYQNYTVIEGFSGNSLRELIDNIKNYLDELMKHINLPLKECECCSGTGVVEKEFDINKR